MGTANKIKVGLVGDEDVDNGTAGASSTFAVEGAIVLDYPNESGLTFYVNDEVFIKWTASPASLGSLNIRYDTNNRK